MKLQIASLFLLYISLSATPTKSQESINWLERDLTISAKEKVILDQFRERVEPFLYHSYMHKDIYLIRWLRAKGFDINATEKMLLNHLKWRKANKIDNIQNEDWSYFERNFGYSVSSVDKKGQPLLIMDNAGWDIRSTLVRGHGQKLVRWMIKMYEDITSRIRQLQDDGQNVTRFTMLNTLENFSIVESGCFQCLQIFTVFTKNYEDHYPESMDKMILVNTPGLFDVVLNVLRPLLSPSTRSALTLYGIDKREWVGKLLEIIDADQLPRDFGGNKELEFQR